VRYVELELADLFCGFGESVAKRGRLASLREVEQDENGQADNGGKARIGSYRGDEVAD
jgi:hypothetical protein